MVKNKKQKQRRLKILAAGDIHGDSDLTKRLADRADREKAELVILAGDITSPIESEGLIKPFKEKNKKVLMLPGNWDSIATVDFLADLYGMKNIHGYSIKHDNIGVFGAGGMPTSNESEKEIFETLRKGHNTLDKEKVKKKIMVTHMHGKDTKSEFSGWEGSQGIRKAIEELQPDIFIHSHIHEAEGMEEKIGKTRVINVGRKGKIIEI